MWHFLVMTQDKLMLGYNSKILTNMYGTRVIADQCLRIILTILLCPNMISTRITQQAVVKFNGYCPLHISYMHEITYLLIVQSVNNLHSCVEAVPITVSHHQLACNKIVLPLFLPSPRWITFLTIWVLPQSASLFTEWLYTFITVIINCKTRNITKVQGYNDPQCKAIWQVLQCNKVLTKVWTKQPI